MEPAPSANASDQRAYRVRAVAWVTVALLCLWAPASLVYPPIAVYEPYQSGLGGREGDAGQYVRMCQGTPLEQIPRPFRYRVFTPLAARYVPLVPHALLRFFDATPEKIVKLRFGIVNLLGLAVAGLLMFALGTALGLTTGEGVLAVFLFYASFPVVNHAAGIMVEAWAYAFLLLGVVAALRDSHLALVVASLLGMLAKETTLLLVPVVLLLPDRPARKGTKLLALVPGLAAYAWFRYVLYPGGLAWRCDVGTSLANLSERMADAPYWIWILFQAVITFGMLWPLAALGLWRLRGSPGSPLVRLAWLVPIVLLLPFLTTAEYGRVWFFAFPAMIPLAVVGVRHLLAGPQAAAPGAA